jgi:hypothetical protein
VRKGIMELWIDGRMPRAQCEGHSAQRREERGERREMSRKLKVYKVYKGIQVI